MIPAAAASIIAGFADKLSQHAFNQADYSYTHRMTAAPQQVAELRQAGLNPALAYGQIGQAQGQSLGNYKSDQNVGELIQKDPLIKSQIETSNAQKDYYEALAEKTRSEADETAFRVLHQEDLYNMDFQYKGLLNRKTAGEIYGQSLHNRFQEIENEIRNIDWQKHDRMTEAEISRIVNQSGLMLALANTENTLRDWRVREIQSNLQYMVTMRSLLRSEISLNRKRALTEEYTGMLQKTSAMYYKWLTKDATDFSTFDARNRFGLYAPTIVNGVSSVIDAAVTIATKGRGNKNAGGYSNPYNLTEYYYQNASRGYNYGNSGAQ